MVRYLSFALITLLAGCIVPLAWADVVVDGYDDLGSNAGEWDNPDSYHDDPQDVFTTTGSPQAIPEYDIDYTKYIWDLETGRSAFLGATIDPMIHGEGDYAGDIVEILINADDDPNTGGNYHQMTGADYRVFWNLDGAEYTTYNLSSSSNAAGWFEWNSSLSTWVVVAGPSGDDVVIAWGDNSDGGNDYSIVEASIDPTLFGSPDAFQWGMYLDQGTTASDDASPDNMTQRGYTPEPGTMALLTLGIAGLLGWRRRQDD